MDRIFLGMVFVMLDLNLNLDGCTIGLIPDWLGYWMLAKGFAELAEEWEGFRKVRPAALVMVVYTAVLYAMDLFALSIQEEILAWLLWLVAAVVFLYILRQIIRGIRAMEDDHGWDLGGGKLEAFWLPLAVLQIVAVALNWVPLVGVVCAIAMLVACISFLVALNGTKKQYHEYVD